MRKKYSQMFLHHFVCSVHFPTVQKHTGFETIPHLYWKNDKGVKPANSFQPAFSGHSVVGTLIIGTPKRHKLTVRARTSRTEHVIVYGSFSHKTQQTQPRTFHRMTSLGFVLSSCGVRPFAYYAHPPFHGVV